MAMLITQQFQKLPYPSTDCSGKTVVITGSNIGLGKEAARHFVRLHAHVILAVRSLSKGLEAQKDIDPTLKNTSLMELDLSSYKSVKTFAANLATVPRIDIFIANASIATHDYALVENNESTITVNVVSTMLLVLLVFPILRGSASKFNTTPTLSVVCSGIHHWAAFAEKTAPNIFDKLNDKKTAAMADRYPVSKLLQILAVREIADKESNLKPTVVLNYLDPGFCHSALTRDATGLTKVKYYLMKGLLARSTEVGSRTLVFAGLAGIESQGSYMNHCYVRNDSLSSFVRSEEGAKIQKRVWAELKAKLEVIQPGITE